MGWLEMTAQPLLQFRTVALDPEPDCRVVRLQAAFAKQLLDIAERKRVPQVPAHGAKNQLGFGLSPLEDRRSDCLFHDLFRLPAAVGQSCNRTLVRILKKICNEMEDAGTFSAKPVPGYLIECLCWNVPDAAFTESTWDARVQSVLAHLWRGTKNDTSCDSWCEVDNIKYLFRVSQSWTRAMAHAFINEAWDYIGVRSS